MNVNSVDIDQIYGGGMCVVGSVQTMSSAKRLNKYRNHPFGLIVVDEAHHCTSATYRRVLDYFRDLNPSLKIVGITATPNRADGTAIGTVFDSEAYQMTISDAIDGGWLVPVEQEYIVCEQVNYDTIKMNKNEFGEADFNVVLVPEVAASAAQYLQRVLGQPMTRTIPIGVGATREFIAEVAALAGVDPRGALEDGSERSSWYARSVDSTYLTGKRVFVFGDATHAVAAARVAAREFGFEVVGLGTYSREFARDVREAAKLYGVEPLITDDYLEVEAKVAELQPELVLGTQMERHIAKRLGIPCAVISAPMHVQDFPARHAPQMGFEGANVLFDTWVHPLMMGLEEHLLTMFRGDFEFHDSAPASHLGSAKSRAAEPAPQACQAGEAVEADEASRQPPIASGLAQAGHSAAEPIVAAMAGPSDAPAAVAGLAEPARVPASASWAADAERELQKIPFFVRGKARRNTERFALEKGLATITVDTLYDAKAHYSR
jgi:light-independent protochlorophyllide reductase subunit B